MFRQQMFRTDWMKQLYLFLPQDKILDSTACSVWVSLGQGQLTGSSRHKATFSPVQWVYNWLETVTLSPNMLSGQTRHKAREGCDTQLPFQLLISFVLFLCKKVVLLLQITFLKNKNKCSCNWNLAGYSCLVKWGCTLQQHPRRGVSFPINCTYCR